MEHESEAVVRPLVRGRRGGDVEGCVRALAEVHQSDGYPVNWPEDPAAWLSPPSLLAAWVAQWDGRVVGHIGLCGSGSGDAAPALWGSRQGAEGDGEATVVVSRLFVAPVARGRGLGALLLRQAVQDAYERALRPVLDVVASDAAALALYERLGWEPLGTVEQRWGPGQTVAVRCFAAPSISLA